MDKECIGGLLVGSPAWDPSNKRDPSAGILSSYGHLRDCSPVQFWLFLETVIIAISPHYANLNARTLISQYDNSRTILCSHNRRLVTAKFQIFSNLLKLIFWKAWTVWYFEHQKFRNLVPASHWTQHKLESDMAGRPVSNGAAGGAPNKLIDRI